MRLRARVPQGGRRGSRDVVRCGRVAGRRFLGAGVLDVLLGRWREVHGAHGGRRDGLPRRQAYSLRFVALSTSRQRRAAPSSSAPSPSSLAPPLSFLFF